MAGGTNSTTTQYVAGLAMEPAGQIALLWGCFFVFGNLFAGFWLSRAFLNAHPEIAYQVKQLLGRCGLARSKSKKHHSAGQRRSGSFEGQKMPAGAAAAAGATAAAAGAGAASMNGHHHHHHHIRQPDVLCMEQSTELQATSSGALNGVSPMNGVTAEDSGSSSSSDDYSDASHQVVQLDWRNMCYGVKAPSGRKMILQGIYGCAKPYQLQGLMGPSGAGKSTLMDLLTMRTARSTKATQRAIARAAAAASVAGGAASAVSLPVTEDQLSEGVGGQLLVNGVEISRKDFMSISAYVPQHDNLVPTMTAYESVSFYARVVLAHDTPVAVRKSRIARVLRMMGLSHAQHTLVGGTLPGGIMLRGMSGGERKRLAIACGVVSGPSMVFLDEPTSGLDSFAALNVVLFLKSMATQGGATLLASLHQPRAAIWNQLDQVTLLSSGRLMYTGPTEGLVPWFSSQGYYYDPETHGMASDWALDLVSLGFTKPGNSTPEDQQQQQQRHRQRSGFGSSNMRLRALAAATAGQQPAPSRQQRSSCLMSSKEELTQAADAFLGRLEQAHPDWFFHFSRSGHQLVSPPPALLTTLTSFADDASRSSASQVSSSSPVNASAVVVGFEAIDEKGKQQQQQQAVAYGEGIASKPREGAWRSFVGGIHKYRALLGREMLITTRNPADVGGRLMTFTYVAFLSGLVAWNLPGDAESMFDRLGVCYAVLSFYLLMPFVFMSLFTSDKRFFAADTAARLYHPSQYFLSKVSVALPFNVIVAIVFHFVYYGMVGMRHGVVPMVESCVVSVLTGLIAMQAIYCCAIVASSQDLAFVYAIAWTALNLLINPYMALFEGYSLGWGFSWLRFLSPCNFAWQALVQIEFKGRGFDCNNGSGLRAINLFPELLPDTSRFRVIKQSLSSLGPRSTNGQCVASGDALVQMYTSGLSVASTVGILVGYFVLLMGLTYIVVWRSSKTKLKA